ncbi:MAG: class I SAM-dependent methyltransferase [Cyclobacteriaceae bacterium]
MSTSQTTPSSIQSPLDTSANAILIEKIDKEFIIGKYWEELNIDVSKQFNSIDHIGLFQCTNTGFRFFFPSTIAGDGGFYGQLNSQRPYYHKWNWEQALACNYINNGDDILDVGCGEGSFLIDIRKRKSGIKCLGIDINKTAVEEAKKKGIDAICCTPEEFNKSNDQKFDVITVFQVLEHIPNVVSFTQCLSTLLKPNGKLIVSVPNNAPYYDTFEKYNVLNLPPHHMGWWDKDSLFNLGRLLNLRVLEQNIEPVRSYKRKLLFRYENQLQLRSLVSVIPAFLVKIYFKLKKNNYSGRHIMTIYSRTS